MTIPAIVLALDSGSPWLGVALAGGGESLGSLTVERRDGGPQILVLVDRALREAGVAPGQIGGIVALHGPGSFTGVRIACATALGLASAWGVRATAVSSLEALALCGAADAGDRVALVEALHGDWFAQRFRRTAAGVTAIDTPRFGPPTVADFEDAGLAVGFGSRRMIVSLGLGIETVDPPSPCLAAALGASSGLWDWSAERLAHPLYLRPAATSRPKAR